MGRGRARTQRRHFAQSRENAWKRPKSNPSSTSDEPNNNTITTDDANTNENPTWQPFANQNPAFEEYYKEQGIVKAEEWDTFVEFLRKPLPAAFRINSSSQFCEDIRLQLENDFMKTLQAEFTGIDEGDAIRPLPWYPENLAWHSNFSRMQLRKNQTLERFHEFLKLENEIGNITRQEAVSMVPPLFLDVHPDHFVLDMCAAPGSKTFQLLEILHRSTEAGSLPNGLVVANDLDVQRCNLLIHQTKRMCTANLMVTNHEAQQFPGCRLSKGHISTSKADNQVEADLSQLVFDRVLCDVPCSGDGTLRKAPDIWRKWNTGMGNGLHGLQIHIAMRGASLLKVGGRMVYSTCSMNPIENEAAVAEVLRRCGGSLELLDVSSELPQLIRRPGLKKWKVRDRGTWLASYKDVAKSHRHGVIPSMFPSGRNFKDLASEGEEPQNGHVTNAEEGNQQSDTPLIPAADVDEEYSDFPLERCMRIVPHDQNGGAFFIAVFQKVAPLPAAVLDKPSSLHGKFSTEGDGPIEKGSNGVTESINELENDLADDKKKRLSEATSGAESIGIPENAVLDPDSSGACEEQNSNETEEPASGKTGQLRDGRVGKRKLQMQGKWRGVDPVVFFKDETVIGCIKSFYGIDESFPLNGHLITRNSDTNHVKRIYYISKSVKEVLELNFKVGQQLKITSIGLKMFERQSSREGTSAPCSFRISSEGLPLLLPYITKQILYASPVDFKHLLQYKSVKFADFVDADLGDKASKLQPGCCVIVLRNGDDPLNQNLSDKSTIAIGCWRGKASISVMVTAIDCKELLERLLERMDTGKSALDGESKPLNETDERKAVELTENGEHDMPEIEQ